MLHEVKHLPVIGVGWTTVGRGNAGGNARVTIAHTHDRVLRQAGQIERYMPVAHAQEGDLHGLINHSTFPPMLLGILE